MLDFHNIWMTKKPKKLNLPKNSCGIRDMFEYVIYLFNRNFFPKMGVICRANNTIATFPNNFLDFVSAAFTIFREEIYIYRCLRTKQALFMPQKKQDRKEVGKTYIRRRKILVSATIWTNFTHQFRKILDGWEKRELNRPLENSASSFVCHGFYLKIKLMFTSQIKNLHPFFFVLFSTNCIIFKPHESGITFDQQDFKNRQYFIYPTRPLNRSK